uniref:Uncharacterized protein n=1 Tax=Meloidogyne incognita TaxID=6306 RepID=A0A914KSQ3_MELIC
MTVLPIARAGANFQACMRRGKFHGMIWPVLSFHGFCLPSQHNSDKRQLREAGCDFTREGTDIQRTEGEQQGDELRSRKGRWRKNSSASQETHIRRRPCKAFHYPMSPKKQAQQHLSQLKKPIYLVNVHGLKHPYGAILSPI